MTVEGLIQELQQYNPSAKVYVETDGSVDLTIKEVDQSVLTNNVYIITQVTTPYSL